MRDGGNKQTGRSAKAAGHSASVPNASGFAPCPFCKQYSHSIGEDRLAAALMHFEMMYAHPLRGHPMGRVFDERTRDAAQVLIAAARAAQGTLIRQDGDGTQIAAPLGSGPVGNADAPKAS
jgi:hypothetical protein